MVSLKKEGRFQPEAPRYGTTGIGRAPGCVAHLVPRSRPGVATLTQVAVWNFCGILPHRRDTGETVSPAMAMGKIVRSNRVVPDAKSSSLLRVGAVVLAAALVVTAVFVNRQITTSQAALVLPETSPATSVRVTRIERRAVVRRTEFHGFLVPLEELSISADVVGEIVEQHVEVSSEVTKGQVLYKIDDAVRNIKHAEALAGLDRASSEQTLAEARLARVRGLERGQTTSIEHQQAESKFLSASAIRRQAEAAVSFAALQLERTIVRSPIDGIVSDIFQRRGEHAQLGLPLVRVIDVARLRLVAEIEDLDVVWVKIGQPATVVTDTFPGEAFEGTVYRIHPQARQNSRKFEIEILLTNADQRLKPGFFMQGTILEPEIKNPETPISEALFIPRESVVEQFGASFCYVVTEEASADGDDALGMVATRTAVRVVPNHFAPRSFQVVDGVVAGDVVVTKGLKFLSERTRVIITD